MTDEPEAASSSALERRNRALCVALAEQSALGPG